MFQITENIGISECCDIKNNYNCVYYDLSFNLVCYYDNDKFNEYSKELNNINYSFERSLLNKDIDINRKKILLWMVNVCEYISNKKVIDSDIDKILMIIVGETNGLFNQ
jgi:hypothetical protein